jgi:Flp pilus assembly protein TadG
MMALALAGHPGASRLARQDRRGVAALEFAMVAPIFVIMIWGVYDVARALIAWEQTYHAAEAVAQAAEKFSVTNRTNAGTGAPISALTSNQMQDAMSTIYAEMPFLGLGNGTGAFKGSFSVTLSGVVYTPTCPASATGVCQPQVAAVAWSSYLNTAAAQVLRPPTTPLASVQRQCTGSSMAAAFPNDSTQLTVLLNPNLISGTSINLIPQVVADVRYVFQPTFPLINRTFTFWASATFPAPLGGDDNPIQFDLTDSTTNIGTVGYCVPYTPL